jgi:hypothetical protein
MIEMDLGVKQKANLELTTEFVVDNSWERIIELVSKINNEKT